MIANINTRVVGSIFNTRYVFSFVLFVFAILVLFSYLAVILNKHQPSLLSAMRHYKVFGFANNANCNTTSNINNNTTTDRYPAIVTSVVESYAYNDSVRLFACVEELQLQDNTVYWKFALHVCRLQTLQDQFDLVWTLTDKKYAKFLASWKHRLDLFQSQRRDVHARKPIEYFIIAMDLETMRECKNKFLLCFGMFNEPVSVIKYKISLQLLQHGVSFLFSEMDVYIHQDPFVYIFQTDASSSFWNSTKEHFCDVSSADVTSRQPLLQAPWPNARDSDLIIVGHFGHPRVNIGFYYLQSNTQTRDWMHLLYTTLQRTLEEMKNTAVYDQVLFDAFLQNYDKDTRIKNDIMSTVVAMDYIDIPLLKVRKLDFNIFTAGDGVDDGIYQPQHVVTAHVYNSWNKHDQLTSLYKHGVLWENSPYRKKVKSDENECSFFV